MSEQASSNCPSVENGTRLPARRSFVVQFIGEATAEHGVFSGRIEHVLSGATATFEGSTELLDALESALLSVGVEPPTHGTSYDLP